MAISTCTDSLKVWIRSGESIGDFGRSNGVIVSAPSSPICFKLVNKLSLHIQTFHIAKVTTKVATKVAVDEQIRSHYRLG